MEPGEKVAVDTKLFDVVDLRNFYYRTQLGRVAQRSIRDTVTKIWPDARGQTVVGFGFAVPFLRPYLEDARRVIAPASAAMRRDRLSTKPVAIAPSLVGSGRQNFPAHRIQPTPSAYQIRPLK